MEYNYLYNLTSRPDFSSKYKKTQLDQYKESLLSSLRGPPSKNLEFKNHIKRMATPDRCKKDLNHYRSLSNFKSKQNSNMSTPKLENNKKNFEVFTKEFQTKVISQKKYEFEFNDIDQDKINHLISIGTLSTATSLVHNEGVQGLSLSYIRQLRQFCNEALKSINSN